MTSSTPTRASFATADDTAAGTPRTELFERRTIGVIPDDERHGKTTDLFTIWAASNLGILSIVIGGLGPAVFGLSFGWSVLAIVVGTLGGAVLMALHSVQGAQLGVPQMIQSRGQFGAWGALPVVLIVIVMYIGFGASGLVLAGPAVHALIPGLSPDVGVVLAGVLAMVLAVAGYDTLHRVQRFSTPVFAAGMLLLLVWVLFVHGLPTGFLHAGGVAFGPLLAMISTAAIAQISYAPYVSDYSRYLPRSEDPRRAFWATYLGAAGGALIPMIIGAMLAVIDGDSLGGVNTIMGSLGWLIMIVFFIGTSNATAYNLYGFSLCSITVGETFANGWIPRGVTRVALVSLITAVSVLIALVAASSFLTDLSNLLSIIFYLLVPWTTINLLDYYVIRHGRYAVEEFYRPRGGIYGLVQWPAVSALVLGVAVQVPFMDTTWFTGPIARDLDGDIAWIVGLVVTAVAYLGFRRLGPADPAQ